MREFGVMMTGGSSSIKDLWLPMREAGASARAMLIEAASRQWQLPASECTAALGRITHSSGQSASFGELAQAASQLPLPEAPKLKNPTQFTLIGSPRRRLEAAPKLDGSAVFGMDVSPPGLLYASVTMCPTLGGGLASFQGAAALKLPGVRQVLKVDVYNGSSSGVAVLADTPFHASQALAQVHIDWDHGPNATLNSADVMAQLAQTLDQHKGWAYYKNGDVDTALASASKTITADYQVPYLAHAPMEPMNCTVQFKDGTATVWASTQVPGLARAAAAKALGIASNKVTVQVQFLGGGFGRRLDVDFVGQAAAIAKEAGGAPVQTFWSREQDITHDFYQKIQVHRVWCVIDCGFAINPNLIRQQLESAIVFGLSAALGGEITIKNGQVQQSNLHDFPVLRMDECPVIESHIMASTEPPEGVGEPGTPPIAPAVANAVFALTGKCLRALPLKLA